MDIHAIITGDWHLRNDLPPCRPETPEEWLDLQFSIVRRIFQLAEKIGVTIYHTGDLLHRSNPYYGILGRLQKTHEEEDPDFGRLGGNHDFPYNTFDNAINSGWNLAPGWELPDEFPGAFHFGQSPKDPNADIIFTHQLVWPSEKDKPSMASGKTASELLDEFPKAKWIFTGDYHRAFHYEEDGRHVVNPGCITRQSVNEIDYTPGFYIVDTKKESVEFVEVGDTVPLVTTHLEKTKERDERMAAFIEVIKEARDGETGLTSFKDNLKKKLLNKKLPQGILEIVKEIEEEIGA